VQGHDVGEGAADVDADLHVHGPPGPRADSSAARGVAPAEFPLLLLDARIYDEASVHLGQRSRPDVLHHQLELASEEIEHLLHTPPTRGPPAPTYRAGGYRWPSHQGRGP